MKPLALLINSDAWPMPAVFPTVGLATEFWIASMEAMNKIASKLANQPNFNAQMGNVSQSNTNAMELRIAPIIVTKKIAHCPSAHWRNSNVPAESVCHSNSVAMANWTVVQGICRMNKIAVRNFQIFTQMILGVGLIPTQTLKTFLDSNK